MEEILASIRRIIADDDVHLSARRERLNRNAADEERIKRVEPPALEVAPHKSATEEAAPIREPVSVEAARHDDKPPVDVLAPAEAAGETALSAHDAAAAAEQDFAAEPEFAEHEAAEESEAPPHDAYLSHEATERRYQADAHDSIGSAPGREPLVSSDAAASIAAQFQTLAASMVINDSGLLHDYAREMLRPMLKAWLDDNLPVLVERLVRAEIERVARGGRR